MPSLEQTILDRATRDHGFSLAGITQLEPSRYQAQFHDWLAEGKHGSMDYLARNTRLRLNPSELLEGARSALIVGDLYHTRAVGTSAVDQSKTSAPSGRIARYAQGNDYHKAIKKRLHALTDALTEALPLERFRTTVDTAPIFERELAQLAGLGWIGKHTLAIHPKAGSYFFLGVILTTLDLTPPADQTPITDHCGTCSRCIDACPTDAITPYSVDASRCISYLTIERRETIPAEFHDAIGDWIFGCDICQEVCPHNSERDADALPAFARSAHDTYHPRRTGFEPLEVLQWTQEDRQHALIRSAMKRATLGMMKRNAMIVATNHLLQHTESADDRRDSKLVSLLAQLAHDEAEEELVRQTAHQSLRRLQPSV